MWLKNGPQGNNGLSLNGGEIDQKFPLFRGVSKPKNSRESSRGEKSNKNEGFQGPPP